MVYASVIVPFHNSSEHLTNCITSIKNQEVNFDFEIILIDNNSTDDSAKIVEKYVEKNSNSDIKLLKEYKQGSYAARNLGIRSSKGEIMVFIDSDCIADKYWLENLLLPFKLKQNMKIFSTGGNINSFSKKTILLNYCDKYCHPQKLSFESDIPFFATSNCAIKKRVFARRMFNENLISGGDLEFFANVLNIKKMHFVDKAIVYHNYELSLLQFIKRFYKYGRGEKRYKKLINNKNKIKCPNLIKLFKEHPKFMVLKIIQDFAYYIGKL